MIETVITAALRGEFGEYGRPPEVGEFYDGLQQEVDEFLFSRS